MLLGTMTRWTQDDALGAAYAVGDLWAAAQGDDDAAAMRCLSGGLLTLLGDGPGLCDRVREWLGVDRSAAATIGVSSKVRIVEDVIVIMCMTTPPEGRIVGEWGPVRLPMWAFLMTLERAGWRVAGGYEQPEEGWPPGTEYIDLPHAPPARGGVN
jgi:hypothetical protein